MVIGGSKGKVTTYLLTHLNFTDNTVKVTQKKIVTDKGASSAAVSKKKEKKEQAGLLKTKPG